MSWTAPITFSEGAPLTAAQLNTMIRDNLLETAPAKASLDAIGGYFVTDEYNRLVIRKPGISAVLDFSDESYYISGSYGDPISNLAGTQPSPGPSVTCQTGTTALVFISVGFKVTGGDADAALYCGVEVSGATDIAPTDKQAIACPILRTDNPSFHTEPPFPAPMAFTNIQAGHVIWFDNLNPGENTFKMVYKVGAQTGSQLPTDNGKATTRRRKMAILPF